MTIEQRAKNFVDSGRVFFELEGRFHRFYQVRGPFKTWEVVLGSEGKHSCSCTHYIYNGERLCSHVLACRMYEERILANKVSNVVEHQEDNQNK